MDWSANARQLTPPTGRAWLPSVWMETFPCLEADSVLFVIRSRYADGTLRVGRGPVRSHVPPSKADRTCVRRVPNPPVRGTRDAGADGRPRQSGSSP
jgi:hypothetical protein